MTRVVIVGEIYNADLQIGGGPMPGYGGQPSHPWVPPGAGPGTPSHPIYIPGVGPAHPIVIPGTPPGQPGSPSHPIYIPIGPDQGLPGQSPYPDQGLPPGQPGAPSHPWVPPAPARLARPRIRSTFPAFPTRACRKANRSRPRLTTRPTRRPSFKTSS